MIIICAWHMKYFGFELVMGEKEPLEDKGDTAGMCQECYDKMLLEPLENENTCCGEDK